MLLINLFVIKLVAQINFFKHKSNDIMKDNQYSGHDSQIATLNAFQ